MKKLRKTLAVVLAMIMLTTMLPVASVSAWSLFTKLELDTVVEHNVGEDRNIYSFTPQESGYYRFYSIDDYDTFATLYNKFWYKIGYSDNAPEGDNFNMVCYLEEGEKYYLKVGANGNCSAFQMCVEKTIGVEYAEVTQEPYNNTVIEGCEDLTVDLSGLEVTFTMSDDSTVLWSYDENDYVYGQDVEVNYNGIKEDVYCIEIVCGDVSICHYLDVVESPVESIEYSSNTSIEYYAETNGYWFDEENYYYYYFYEFPDDAAITVNYKDGTSEVISFSDDYRGLINHHDNQAHEPWGVGVNYTTINYLGAEVDVPVTILPCPFKSVTLNSAPTKDYIYGDHSDGCYYEDGSYQFWLNDFTGLSFTVEYADGTKHTYTDEDFDTENLQLDGYTFEVSDHIVEGPCTVDAYMIYRGASIEFTVDVVETYVDSIEVLTPPTKTEYDYFYYADFTGMTIRVNYKDGTSATATVDSSNLTYYDNGALICEVQVGDDILSIFNEEVMDGGDKCGRYDYITCAGVRVNYYGITYTDSKEIEEITVDNFSMSGEGMVLNIEYTDGSFDELTLDSVVYSVELEDYTYGYALTDKGILDFSIEKLEYENTTGYCIDVLGESCFIDADNNAVLELGDVDGDGDVSIIDSSAIQLYMAQLKLLSDEELSRANVDGDDEVTILDATRIQLFLAQLIPEL